MDSMPSVAGASVNNSFTKLSTNSITTSECEIINNHSNNDINICINRNQQQRQQTHHEQHENQQEQLKHKHKQNSIHVVVVNPGLVQCYEKSEYGSGQTILNLHYSTEKSGSSGYYSSNLCSTSSVEEHIYSEPVVVDDNSGMQLSRTIKSELIKTKSNNNDENESYCKANDTAVRINKDLRVLETSIENLGRHLKNYSRPMIMNDDKMKSLLSSSSLSPFITITNSNIGVRISHERGKYRQLPTIMEGNDNQSILKAQNSWSEDLDDSLVDIDLNSFLLCNNRNHNNIKENKVDNETKDKKKTDLIKFNNNPAVNKVDILKDEFDIENNYKCSKYVNSCPENAYRVESTSYEQEINRLDENNEIDDNDEYRNNDNEDGDNENDQQDESLTFLFKKVEDRIHLENTKAMLEDIKNKLRNLSETTNKYSSCSKLPKDLSENIKTLKRQLESYIKLINYNSELEIKQLCSGLVNNQKLLTLTKALERRKSFNNIIDNSNHYYINDVYSNHYINCAVASSSSNTNNRSKNVLIDSELPLFQETGYFNSNNNIIQSIASPPLSSSSSSTLSLSSLSLQSQFCRNNTEHIINNYNNSVSSSSLRCSTSDPNFKLKRKSLSKIFPLTRNECYQECYSQENYMNFRNFSSKRIDYNHYEIPYENSISCYSCQNHINNKTRNNDDFSHSQRNLSINQNKRLQKHIKTENRCNDDENDSILEWHKNKPSFWELYYGTNRINQSLFSIKGQIIQDPLSPLSYPSSRPESDFTLDLPKAEQLRLKLENEKKFRQRCRILTTFFSLIFFLLTVMVVSLILTRGKRMFGSMI